MSLIGNPNRCGCMSTGVVSTPVSTSCCLKLCHILADKTIYPCNTPGELDITKYITIPSCCDPLQVELRIVKKSDNLRNVTFTKSGALYLINFISDYSEGKDYKSAEITYQVACKNNLLKLQATIVIPFRQIVDFPNCEFGYDPCTGLCKAATGEISISGNPKPEIKIF